MLFESRLRVDWRDIEDLNKKIELCKKLDIKNIIIEPLNFNNSIRKLQEKLDLAQDLQVYYRINLQVKTLKEFKNRIRNLGKLPHVIGIETPNKEVLLQAAKDSRIDVISFSNVQLIDSLSPGIISLLNQNNAFIEFSMAPILVSNKRLQSKNFRKIHKSIELARQLNSNIIISGDIMDPFDIRNPRGWMSICNTLFEIPLNEAKKMLKENPLRLIKRAESRFNRNHIDEGIKLLEE